MASGSGTRPTATARYSFRARAPSASPLNCLANPSASGGSFTKRHTPLVSMSRRCTTRGASASSLPAPSRDASRRTWPMTRDRRLFPSKRCTGWNLSPGGLFTTRSSSSSCTTSNGSGSATRGMARDARRSIPRTRAGVTPPPNASATSASFIRRSPRNANVLAASESAASCSATAPAATATSRHESGGTAATASGQHLATCWRNWSGWDALTVCKHEGQVMVGPFAGRLDARGAGSRGPPSGASGRPPGASGDGAPPGGCRRADLREGV